MLMLMLLLIWWQCDFFLLVFERKDRIQIHEPKIIYCLANTENAYAKLQTMTERKNASSGEIRDTSTHKWHTEAMKSSILLVSIRNTWIEYLLHLKLIRSRKNMKLIQTMAEIFNSSHITVKATTLQRVITFRNSSKSDCLCLFLCLSICICVCVCVRARVGDKEVEIVLRMISLADKRNGKYTIEICKFSSLYRHKGWIWNYSMWKNTIYIQMNEAHLYAAWIHHTRVDMFVQTNLIQRENLQTRECTNHIDCTKNYLDSDLLLFNTRTCYFIGL